MATKAPGPADAVPLLQRYSPVVDAGSDVVFRWTIDDKQSLTFHNVVFNVIYQSAAVFKLSVGGLTGGGGGGPGRAALTFAFSSALLPRTPRLAAGECGGVLPAASRPVPHPRQPTHCSLSLQLTASNHVSNVTVNYNVTVERMHRMRGLWVSAVPPVLPPNATLTLAAHVLVDSAVEVAFL